MADLLTLPTLALWTQNDAATVQADPFAADVIDKVSKMAQFLGGHDGRDADHPLWTLDTDPTTDAPYDVQIVVLQICKRIYGNPGQVIQEGNVGPIGGDRVADAAALLLSLTDAERKTLTRYNDEGDPDDPAVEIFTMRTTRAPESVLTKPVLYVSDDGQVGMTEDQSAYPSWDIPMFSPGDPGDPNLYDED